MSLVLMVQFARRFFPYVLAAALSGVFFASVQQWRWNRKAVAYERERTNLQEQLRVLAETSAAAQQKALFIEEERRRHEARIHTLTAAVAAAERRVRYGTRIIRTPTVIDRGVAVTDRAELRREYERLCARYAELTGDSCHGDK